MPNSHPHRSAVAGSDDANVPGSRLREPPAEAAPSAPSTDAVSATDVNDLTAGPSQPVGSDILRHPPSLASTGVASTIPVTKKKQWGSLRLTKPRVSVTVVEGIDRPSQPIRNKLEALLRPSRTSLRSEKSSEDSRSQGGRGSRSSSHSHEQQPDAEGRLNYSNLRGSTATPSLNDQNAEDEHFIKPGAPITGKSRSFGIWPWTGSSLVGKPSQTSSSKLELKPKDLSKDQIHGPGEVKDPAQRMIRVILALTATKPDEGGNTDSTSTAATGRRTPPLDEDTPSTFVSVADYLTSAKWKESVDDAREKLGNLIGGGSGDVLSDKAKQACQFVDRCVECGDEFFQAHVIFKLAWGVLTVAYK
ncbi:hypothetical protein HK405_001499, partial [Cladochytrium tenue]